ncbi:hypothetical protein [Mycolicibacterium sediminis]|uniref:Uncharacterized protein n=1 Tax=Mycolicibacterium sediminis TaxID=1286180 RepID=A0A7I7QU24_9MYCO|nr:hypothetical protein [Mycolicibacterium sediminis]BBY29878.1 hypothetical protein MSEDJ_39740 [Mycolicibacterium sediminis]
MNFEADGGLWSTGPAVSGPPALAVLEVQGAVLAWTVDDPGGVAATRITFTDVAAADWLWHVVGVEGHTALVNALADRPVEGAVDVPGVEIDEAPLIPLRRIAIGHWARRWWPSSLRDGIAELDGALLDAELAVAQVAAEGFLDEDAVDADVGELLVGRRSALETRRQDGDPRVIALIDACRELAEDAGVWDAAPIVVDDVPARRADYALAAGPGGGGPSRMAVAGGAASVNWDAVPPNVFDAAEETVEWRVEAADGVAVATVRVAMAGLLPATGIDVRLRAGDVTGHGALDANGVARMALTDAGGPVAEGSAWNHDWTSVRVDVGAGVEASAAAVELRSRVRELARARLARPGPDAFLAEVLAAESDY